MDKLQKCALAYQTLLNTIYHLKLYSKGKIINLDLSFKKENFYHLIGLEKLKDLQKTRGKPEKIFDKIIRGDITYEDIAKSVFFLEMSSRLDYFHTLEYILDNDYLTVALNQKKCFGRISADYVIYIKNNNYYIHYFIVKDITDNTYYGMTFFDRTNDDYIVNRQKFTVIYKEKITTNSKQILINKQKKAEMTIKKE